MHNIFLDLLTIKNQMNLTYFFSLCLLLLLICGACQQARAANNVLLFSKTAGFRHSSIGPAVTAIQAQCGTLGWTCTNSEDSTVFTAGGLASYDAVVFVMTTGDILDANQQSAFETWYRAGKGWLGIHSASDTEYTWSWYGSLVGAYFSDHPAGTPTATFRVADRVHPSTSMLPSLWTRAEELYNFQGASSTIRNNNHVLFDVDERTYTGGSEGFDHPMAWCKLYDGGRSMYTEIGHADSAWSETLVVQHTMGAIGWVLGNYPGDCRATLDSAYSKNILYTFTGGEQPMHLAVLPSGGILFAVRQGAIRLFDPVTSGISTVVTLSVTTANEDGLLGILTDPDFATNGFVYVFWSPSGQASGSEANILSRFTMVGSTINIATRRDILSVPVQRAECCHSAGSIAWDGAGNMVISTGDNTNPFDSSGYAPIDERSGRSAWDAQKSSSNTNDLRGKILRITINNAATSAPYYTIPSGNLFTQTAQTRAEIYGMGFRNPFRLAADPVTRQVFIGNVGPDASNDDANRGPKGYDELETIKYNQPINAGWPYCIANNKAYNDFNFGTSTSGALFNCNSPSNNSPNNNGLTTGLPAATSAAVYYPYGSSTEFPEMNSAAGGRTACALHVFRPSDFTAGASYKMPDYFQDGTLLFAEWSRDYFRAMKFDSNGNLVKIHPIWSSFTWKHPVDAIVSPTDGSVYILEFGTDFAGTGAQFSRMRYVGAVEAPTCVITATPNGGSLPLNVQFSSAGSIDPNGDPITFDWDFTNDGILDASGATASTTYTTAATYTAKLIVTDNKGNAAACTTQIIAGNNIAVLKLEQPVRGGVFAWGSRIAYRLSGSDVEDGVVACNRLVVVSQIGHDTHAHDGIPQNGCTGTYVPGRETTVGTFYNILKATYTDNDGLTAALSVPFKPAEWEAENFDATGGVLTETTGDFKGNLNIGWIDDGDWIASYNWNLQNIEAINFRVASVNALANTGYIDVRINSLTGRVIATADIPSTGGWQTWTNVQVPIADTNQFFEIDLNAVKSVRRIVLDTTGSANDYPRGYLVYLSTQPGSSPSTRYGSPIDYVAVGNGTSAVTTIDFPATYARYIRIVQTGENPTYWWAIHELNIYDSALTALPRTAWTFTASSTESGGSVNNVKDGNAATRWATGEPQRNGLVALYFVFRAKVAGQASLFNINYWTMIGQGISSPEPVYTRETAVNCGGSAFTAANGYSYLTDQYFAGGNTYSNTNAIAGTTDDTLYQSERYGTVTYNLPVGSSGAYRTTLKMAEIYWTAVGQRVADYNVEGALVLDNLDIFAAVGANTAYDFQYENYISDGAVTVDMITVVNNAKISAILVEKINQIIPSPVAGIILPGRLEAEAFGFGLTGTFFSDSTTGDAGNNPQCTRGNNVDLRVTTDTGSGSGGCDVYNTANNEWLSYSVYFTKTAVYQMRKSVV